MEQGILGHIIKRIMIVYELAGILVAVSFLEASRSVNTIARRLGGM